MGLLHPAMQSSAQTGFNYLRTTSVTSEDGTGLVSTSYYDGWGRLWEEVQKNIGPNNQDRITYYEYDCRNQLEKVWNSVTVTYNFGNIYPTSLLKTAYNNYYGANEIPYSLTNYENSPLCRPVEKVGPGAQWHNNDKSQKIKYLTNNSTCPCRVIATTEDRQLILLNSGPLYANGELLVTQLEDEDGNLQYEFKDKRDHVIMTRRLDGEETFDTYFVYDSYGNLRSVLPPMVADALSENSALTESNELIQKYAFLYKYDARNRCIAKKLPGSEWEYYIYDMADKLVFSQDGNQRLQSIPKWTFYLYDVFQRMVLKGICSNNQLSDIGSMLVTCVWDGGEGIDGSGYTANIKLNSPEVHIANYYDSYEFLARSGFSTPHFPAATVNAKGYLTGTVSRILGNDISSFIYKALYYDFRGRVTSQVTNSLGKYDIIYTDYTFTGKPLHVQMKHLRDSVVHTEKYSYTYGYEERLDKVEYQLDDKTSIIMSEQRYDDLGRLSEKLLHNGKYSNNYTYNIRDWLTDINGTHFSQSLHYIDGPNKPCYNGNISSMMWNVDSLITRGYRFMYDGLSRLKDAIYGEGNGLLINTNRFDERVTAYDKHGNIQGIKRFGRTADNSYGVIDELSLFYNGNHLKKVDDVPSTNCNDNFGFIDGANQLVEYTYDSNGNLTQDLNKKITDIQYNCLNLPSRILFEDGSIISYLYDANGTKIQTTHMTGNDSIVTGYYGNVIFENGIAKTLLTEEGYVSLTDGKYHYYLKDYQGNNRVVVDQDGNVEEENDYYPFGGLMASSTNSVQAYKYNGKELDMKKSLNWYDYGARMYDPVIGRWHAVDPSSEKYCNWSPYTYCKDNPILRIDIDGKDDYVVSKTGKLTHLKEKKDKDVLYAYTGNEKSPKSENSIEMNEKGLLGNMVDNQRKHGGYKSFGSTSNLTDAANLFQFVAENTDVEWALSVFESDGKNTSVIVTNQQPNTVSNGDSEKGKEIKGEKKVAVHSHPDPKGTKGGYGRDLKNANPKSKNFVYFQANKTFYEYNNTESNIKATQVAGETGVYDFIKTLIFNKR